MPPFGVEDQAEAIALLGVSILLLGLLFYAEMTKVPLARLLPLPICIYFITTVEQGILYFPFIIIALYSLFTFYNDFSGR